jgi:hypothetical protein
VASVPASVVSSRTELRADSRAVRLLLYPRHCTSLHSAPVHTKVRSDYVREKQALWAY